MTSLAAAVGGLSFFTSARGNSNCPRDHKTPTFGVCDMTTGTVLTHLALSPIQYKPTQCNTEPSVKESSSSAAAAAAIAAAASGKEGGADSATPTWQVVDVRSREGGFWIAEVGLCRHFSRIIPSFSHRPFHTTFLVLFRPFTPFFSYYFIL